MTATSPAASLRAAVFSDLIGTTKHPAFVADAVDAILHAPSDAAAEASALDRFHELTAADREKLFRGLVHALRVTARGSGAEPAVWSVLRSRASLVLGGQLGLATWALGRALRLDGAPVGFRIFAAAIGILCLLTVMALAQFASHLERSAP